MHEQLERLKNEAMSAAAKAEDVERLKEVETSFMGRKGRFTAFLRTLHDLSPDEKRSIGASANEMKRSLEELFKKRHDELASTERSSLSHIDVTSPGARYPRGRKHPITLVGEELEELFLSMGFMMLEGPELESDFFNFEALNIPRTHPARDMQDTFYIDRRNAKGELDLVMRTHTSPMQVRAMLKYGAPLRCVVPGRVFRCEATDAVHEHTFYQMEGLMIGKGITLTNLVAVMKELIKGMFGRTVEIRIRPGYFPFVEPGIELDIKCTICGGPGCPACKHSGWLEIMPAGMVHPRVLEYGGLDPKAWSGFAFGLGLTRLAMMKYGIGDIRLFQSGDLRFLEQF